MKRSIALAVLGLLILGINSCATKGCTDPHAPNYNSSATKDDGSCTDLTASIVGSYIGTVQDSTYGGFTDSAAAQTITITKIDDSHIQVSPTNNSAVVPFTASVQAGSNGDLIFIPSQTYQGLSISGITIVASNGNASNGAYNSTLRQFASAIQINNSGTLSAEVFAGVRQ
jgi:hypothetical protein